NDERARDDAVHVHPREGLRAPRRRIGAPQEALGDEAWRITEDGLRLLQREGDEPEQRYCREERGRSEDGVRGEPALESSARHDRRLTADTWPNAGPWGAGATSRPGDPRGG